jgi:hypothetical protein
MDFFLCGKNRGSGPTPCVRPTREAGSVKPQTEDRREPLHIPVLH